MTVQARLRTRVWVEDVWDMVELAATPDWTVARLKEEALRHALAATPNPDRYEVKFRGGLVVDEDTSLRELGSPDNAAFIVLSARRRPVR